MRRPLLCFVGAAALLIALAMPAFSMVTPNRALEQLPPSTDVRVGNAILTSRITGLGQGREGALDDAGAPAPAARPAGVAARLTARLADDPLITGATVEPAGGGLIVVGCWASTRSRPRPSTCWCRGCGARGAGGRGPWVERTASRPSTTTSTGGRGDLWKVMALVLVLSYLVLLVLLRSVLLPLKAVIMNLLSIGAAYGVIVMVFQWGWLDFTGYHSLGHINTLNPALMLAITFGLAMDYEVFLLSRIRERYEATGDNARAVAEGLAAAPASSPRRR